MEDIKRKVDESELSYIWRLCSAKDNGTLDLNWEQLGEIFNKELREDETQYYSESAYRKRYQAAKEFYEEIFKHMNTNDYLKEIEREKQEIKKERFRLYDERNALNKQLRNEARLEDNLDRLESKLNDIGETQFAPFEIEINKSSEERALLVVISDMHLGQEFSNVFGDYNSDIAKHRLQKYLGEILNIANYYGVKDCYVSLQGDLISGNIHRGVDVNNRENVIEQITIASELLSNFVYALSGVFDNVTVKSVNGNHSRITKKDDALKDERLDYIIPFCMKAKLSHLKNVSIDLATNIDSTIAIFDILGKDYISVHGDYDSYTKKGVSDLSMLLGYIPYAIIFGHLHTVGYTEEGGVKLIRGGSFSGSGDDYTIEKRITGKPSQVVCLCTKDGIKGVFPIDLE